MSLTKKLTTMGGLLAAADYEPTNENDYVFEDVSNERRDPTIIEIPKSLDDMQHTIRQMMNHQVDIQAERERITIEEESIERELKRHRIALSREMLHLGIPAPMANEELDQFPPEIPTQDKADQ